MVIDNLAEARRSRRKIIDLLRKQQSEDAYCAEKLKQLGLEAKRKLLQLLARWLVSFEPDKEPNEYDQSALAKTKLSLEEWVSAQRTEALLTQELTEAKRREEAAHELYDKVAPFGFASKLFMNDAEKAKAERFQQEYRSAKASREEIDQKLARAREYIRRIIGRFLRSALEPESLKLLVTESSIKEELKKLFDESDRKVTEVWRPHSEQQKSSLSVLGSETESLSSFYLKGDVREGRVP